MIGVDCFEGPFADFPLGDFTERADAIRQADKNGGPMTPVYVYDDQRYLIYEAGSKHGDVKTPLQSVQLINQNQTKAVRSVVLMLFSRIMLRTPIGDHLLASESPASHADNLTFDIEKIGNVSFDPTAGIDWIHKNTPYCEIVGFGLHSQNEARFWVQALQGMVRVSIQEVQNDVAEIIRLVQSGEDVRLLYPSICERLASP